MTTQEALSYISAATGLLSAVGVFLAYGQLRLMKQQAVTEFEDALAREYRELSARLPTKALLGRALTEAEYQAALDELIHYVDLCNEQVFLRRQARISESTWINWREGISSNLQRPAFARAWKEIKECGDNLRTSSTRERIISIRSSDMGGLSVIVTATVDRA